MELLKHIGVFTETDDTFAASSRKLKGIAILYFLLNCLVAQQVIRVFCVVISCLLPQPARYIQRASEAQFWSICIYFMRLNGSTIKVSGDGLNCDSAVIISNHRSLADHIVMAHLACVANHSQEDSSLTLPRISFFSWFLVWQVPSWHILSNQARCDENWELDESLAKTTFNKLLRSKFPEWIVLFPEVNIWSQENFDLHQEQAVHYFLPDLRNLLYPRFSGLFNVVSALDAKSNYKFTKLYDITIRYGEEVEDTPSLMEIFAGEKAPMVHVHVRTKLFSRIPTKRDKMEKYLESLWVEKDKTLSVREGNNPKEPAATLHSPSSAIESVLSNRLLKSSTSNNSRSKRKSAATIPNGVGDSATALES